MNELLDNLSPAEITAMKEQQCDVAITYRIQEMSKEYSLLKNKQRTNEESVLALQFGIACNKLQSAFVQMRNTYQDLLDNQKKGI